MKYAVADYQGPEVFPKEAWNQIALGLGLSRREVQIVRGIFAGLTELAIASSLSISPHTVHTHVERLHHKLGVVDRVGLVVRITGEFLRLTNSLESGLPPVCARRSAGECPMND